jgi:hypothetical protein
MIGGHVMDWRITRLLAALGVSALTCGASPPLAGALGQGTWMGGPGCGGRVEWRQHPATFPFFCDGAAVVEHARWKNWGKATATARATMNEADLRHGSSVATAPRVHTAIVITATHIESCGGRRAYTSAQVRFYRPHKAPLTSAYPIYLPHCSAGAPPKGAPSERLWSALEGKVECGPTAPPLAELLCQSSAIPPPPNTTPDEGDAGFVFLHATGAPMVARVSQLLWPEPGPFTPLAAGATWSDAALRITCNVAVNEIRCTNASGNGFTISQTSYAPF